MWGLKKIGQRAIKVLAPKNDNMQEISLFDVKELYDAAYEEKTKARVSLKRFKALMAKATKLDAAYRAQLTANQAIKYGRAA